MPNSTIKAVLCAALALPILVGCSNRDELAGGQLTEQRGEFSEESKIAARALSTSNDASFAAADGPYTQALLCRTSIDVIANRFAESGVFNAEQQQAINQAQAYYDRQLSTLGGRDRKTTADIQHDLKQAAENNPDTSSNVRIAVACLQDLQQTGTL
jgi:hypothetical protein